MIKSTDAIAALRRHVGWLQPQVHDEIVSALRADGLIADNGGEVRASATPTHIRSMAAAASADSTLALKLARLQKFAKHSLGVALDPNKVIDPDELDRKLAGKDTSDRMMLKSELAAAGCL